MKKKLYILAILLMTFSLGSSTSCVSSYYIVNGDGVVFTRDNVTLKDVDIKTFKTLNWAFAMDKNKVYYLGKHLKDIDAGTFEIIRDNKERNNVIILDDRPRCGGDSTIKEFKDKNGTYKLEDIQTGKLKLEE